MSPAQHLRAALDRVACLAAEDRVALVAACERVEALEEEVRRLAFVRPGSGRFTPVETEQLRRVATMVNPVAERGAA